MINTRKKYHVYGLGNALVDYEYLVEDTLLNQFHLTKSSMTLIDEQLRRTLFENLSNFKKKKGGGSAANTLLALAQLGARVCYSCKVGSDDDGEFYLNDLSTQGVDHHVKKSTVSEGVTGSCIVLVTPDAERTMCTYLGATAGYNSQEINWDYFQNSEYLYIEGYLFCSDLGTDAVKKSLAFAEEHKIKIALTCSDAGVVETFRSRFESCLVKPIDLIFCNEAEALALTQKQDIHAALQGLKKFAKQIVITRSAKGALIYNANQIIEVPGKKVTPIDANGAGDMFAGAYIYGLTQQWNEKKAAEFACHCASEVIQVYGPRLEKQSMLSIAQQYL